MREEIIIDMSWKRAVPLLIVILQDGSPLGRANAKAELMRLAEIGDNAVATAKVAAENASVEQVDA